MEVAGEQPHAPLPPRPESPQAATGAGGYVEAGDLGMKEMATEEGEYGPSDSAVELLFGDDVYVGMDTYLANVPLLPMPTVVPPPPLGSCERRNCTFHAAEGVYQKSSRTVGSGNGGTGRCAGEVSAPATGECRQDGKPEAPMLGNQVCYVQLGDIVVFDRRPGQVRMPEQEERLPMAVRLVARRLLREAWLDGVAEEGLYVGLGAWLPSHGARPLSPPVLGSHAVLVALHLEGMEVVLAPGAGDKVRYRVDSQHCGPRSHLR